MGQQLNETVQQQLVAVKRSHRLEAKAWQGSNKGSYMSVWLLQPSIEGANHGVPSRDVQQHCVPVRHAARQITVTQKCYIQSIWKHPKPCSGCGQCGLQQTHWMHLNNTSGFWQKLEMLFEHLQGTVEACRCHSWPPWTSETLLRWLWTSPGVSGIEVKKLRQGSASPVLASNPGRLPSFYALQISLQNNLHFTEPIISCRYHWFSKI